GRYLLEAVVRTVKIGHPFTQGTADSNEVWVEVRAASGGRVIGRSGGRAPDGEVDPWSHFVNAFILDREGYRIDRRNPQDIFVPLYDHQIPPGAADVVHYLLEVPRGVHEPSEVEVRLLFRKFDTTYMKHFQGAKFLGNDLPITVLARDRVVLPVAGGAEVAAGEPVAIPEWERWNDYGIALLRKGTQGASKGELRQAEEAFLRVERLGRPDGPLNLARVFLKEGRLEEAVAALRRAAEHDPPAPPWSVLWFTGLVNEQNGVFDEAIRGFQALVRLDTAETRDGEFDFSQDYRLLNELGKTLFERARQARGEEGRPAREEMLREAAGWFHRVLELEPENVTAHYNLALILDEIGEKERAEEHRALHAKYRPDENARDRAVTAARLRYPAADHAAEAIVIYDLRRPGAYEVPVPPAEIAHAGG
ncbi:MAG: tetratricopeptide repeat protein, partial [Acidobacteria bacterium]|nr:tetratricopeptide repeat protein [Acidobacteriota bacterium]